MSPKTHSLKFFITLFANAFAIALALFAGSIAKAELVFAPAFRYESIKSTDNSGVVGSQDTRTIILDAKLGSAPNSNGLYWGGIYRYEDTAFSGGGAKITGSGIGPSIGYVNGGGSIIASYFILAERKFTSGGSENKLSQGAGLQVDVAWTPQFSSNLGLGPQITYRSIKYSKSQIGAGTETSNSYEETTIDPAIVLWWKF